MFTKLIRSTKDIGIFGKKGIGKTTILSMIALLEYNLKGSIIYSNIPLNVPHIFIKDFNDFKKMDELKVRGIFIGDDFERWFDSRNIKNNEKLKDIILDWGKYGYGISLYYSSKREMGIDKSLRESTSEFWEVQLRTKYYNKDIIKMNKIKNILDLLYIKINRFDENLEELNPYYIEHLEKIVPYFDTKYKVKKLIN